jgi:hypothetical protein
VPFLSKEAEKPCESAHGLENVGTRNLERKTERTTPNTAVELNQPLRGGTSIRAPGCPKLGNTIRRRRISHESHGPPKGGPHIGGRSASPAALGVTGPRRVPHFIALGAAPVAVDVRGFRGGHGQPGLAGGAAEGRRGVRVGSVAAGVGNSQESSLSGRCPLVSPKRSLEILHQHQLVGRGIDPREVDGAPVTSGRQPQRKGAQRARDGRRLARRKVVIL